MRKKNYDQITKAPQSPVLLPAYPQSRRKDFRSVVGFRCRNSIRRQRLGYGVDDGERVAGAPSVTQKAARIFRGDREAEYEVRNRVPFFRRQPQSVLLLGSSSYLPHVLRSPPSRL